MLWGTSNILQAPSAGAGTLQPVTPLRLNPQMIEDFKVNDADEVLHQPKRMASCAPDQTYARCDALVYLMRSLPSALAFFSPEVYYVEPLKTLQPFLPGGILCAARNMTPQLAFLAELVWRH